MRLVRSAPCLALAGSLVGAGVSQAAVKKPKPVCNLVTDAAGDGSFVATPNSPALDVLSADLASSSKAITAVVRVASLASDPFTMQGKEYKFLFTVGGVQHYFRVQSAPGLGDSFDYGDVVGGSSTSGGTADGAYDPATNSVRFSVPKSTFPDLKGKTATDLIARSYISLGAVYEQADEGTSTKTYKDLTASCVKP
jgi:hypothetical protein